MRLNELINHLEDLRDQHGDIPVTRRRIFYYPEVDRPEDHFGELIVSEPKCKRANYSDLSESYYLPTEHEPSSEDDVKVVVI